MMKKVVVSAVLTALLVLGLGTAALASGEGFLLPAAVEEDSSDLTPAPDEDNSAQDGTDTDTETDADEPEQTPFPEDRPDGWNYIGEHWYYYVGGYKDTSSWEVDDGYRYYVDEEGRMVAGFHTIDGSTYYFDPGHTGTYGAMQTGWQSIGGQWYLFEPTGEMVVSEWRDDDGHRYYLDEDGHMAAGLASIGEDTYCFSVKHDGTYGAMLTGWQSKGGSYYYFDPVDGTMATSSWEMDGGERYYLGEDGRMAVGIAAADGVVRYFNDKHDGTFGAMRSGWQSVGGDYYYFEAEDGMAVSCWKWDGDLLCYLGEDGRMVTGFKTIDGVTYYFNDKHDGTYGSRVTKPVYVDGEMYMFGSDGALVTDSDVTLLGKNWHVNDQGVIEGYVTTAGRKAAAVLDQVGWNLRSAFDWTVRMTYHDRWLRAPAGAVHTEWYANRGFDDRKGNCYVRNSTLYQMIKMLGYEVYFVEGGVLSAGYYYSPHAWTEVIHDRELYVYDANFTSDTGMNGFHIQYGQRGTWVYGQYKRVD